MDKLTQLEKFSKQEEILEAHLQSMNDEIEVMKQDIGELLTQKSNLTEGRDENAWLTYCEVLLNKD